MRQEIAAVLADNQKEQAVPDNIGSPVFAVSTETDHAAPGTYVLQK